MAVASKGSRAERRAKLLARVALAGRDVAAAAVTFHTTVAAHQHLSVTEEKALDLLERDGPLTAGQLSKRSGLAPASVTGLVNRLEGKGFARRVQHPRDGRRVLIELHPERAAGLEPLFADFLRSMDELYAGYTGEQLKVIAGFLTEAARRQREAAAKLAQPRP